MKNSTTNNSYIYNVYFIKIQFSRCVVLSSRFMRLHSHTSRHCVKSLHKTFARISAGNLDFSLEINHCSFILWIVATTDNNLPKQLDHLTSCSPTSKLLRYDLWKETRIRGRQFVFHRFAVNLRDTVNNSIAGYRVETARFTYRPRRPRTSNNRRQEGGPDLSINRRRSSGPL